MKIQFSRSFGNVAAFWIFGLCNNYVYVVMLSAAADILHSKNTTHISKNNASRLDCNPIGTGAVLLADIIPSLLIKLLAPLFIQKINFHFKVTIVVSFAVASFLIVASSKSLIFSIFGVILASLSSGFGESTFLCMTTYFDKKVLSAWSSGTGAAGVVGSLSYASLAMLLGPRTTLYFLPILPMMAIVVYAFLLDRPQRSEFSFKLFLSDSEISEREIMVKPATLHDQNDQDTEDFNNYAVHSVAEKRTRLTMVKDVFPLMICLGLVYFFEYLINQALFELLYFQGAFLEHAGQYRWYQVLYQVGVFISRSSVTCFTFRPIWILSVLQGFNVALFLTHIMMPFLYSIYIVFGIILYEGLLGGLAYVNTFNRISTESKDREKEFKMAVATVSDSLGITLAGLLAVPLHNVLCSHF